MHPTVWSWIYHWGVYSHPRNLAYLAPAQYHAKKTLLARNNVIQAFATSALLSIRLPAHCYLTAFPKDHVPKDTPQDCL